MNYLKSIASFKTGTPPNVKEARDKQGDKQIISARIGRTPVASAITAMLKKLSDNVPYDVLFHLFIELTLQNGKRWILEKNERINLEEKKVSDAEWTDSFPVGKTLNDLFATTASYMGDKFLPYQSGNNNCQFFITGVLQANGYDTPDRLAFVQQDTKAIFEGNPALRKFANSVTDLGGYFNATIQGGKISNELTNYDIDAYLSHIKGYNGCFIKHELKRIKNGFTVINLNGQSHWTCMFKQGDLCLYFDSFGFVPPEEIVRLCPSYYFSSKQIQDIDHTSCGFYVICFVKYLSVHKDKMMSYKAFMKLFGKPAHNDKVLEIILKKDW